MNKKQTLLFITLGLAIVAPGLLLVLHEDGIYWAGALFILLIVLLPVLAGIINRAGGKPLRRR